MFVCRPVGLSVTSPNKSILTFLLSRPLSIIVFIVPLFVVVGDCRPLLLTGMVSVVKSDASVVFCLLSVVYCIWQGQRRALGLLSIYSASEGLG